MLEPAPAGLSWEEHFWRVTRSQELEDKLKLSAMCQGAQEAGGLLDPPGPSTGWEPIPPLGGTGGQVPRALGQGGGCGYRASAKGIKVVGSWERSPTSSSTLGTPTSLLLGNQPEQERSGRRVTICRCQSRAEWGWGERTGESMGAQVRSRELVEGETPGSGRQVPMS